MREFNLCNLFKRNVIQQIKAAVNYKYLVDLIKSDTGILTGTVPTIHHTLFASYGDITAQSLAQKKTTTKIVLHASDNIKDYFQHTTLTQIPGNQTMKLSHHYKNKSAPMV